MDRSIPNFFLYGGGGPGGPTNSTGDMAAGGGGGAVGGTAAGATEAGGAGVPSQQQHPGNDPTGGNSSALLGGMAVGGDAGSMSQSMQFAGYPALMQQYFQQQQQQQMQQQQQQQQQQMQQQQQQQQVQMMGGAAAGMDPRFAGFAATGFVAAPTAAGMMGMGGPGGGGMNMAAMGMMGNPMMAAPGVVQGHPGAAMGGFGLAGVGYVDNNRMMLSQGWGAGAQAAAGYPGMMGAAAGPMAAMATQVGAGGDLDPYAESGILGPWSATSAGLLGKMASNSATDGKGKKFRKKPKDRPKRPLSAYNIFFKEERARILEKLPTASDDTKKEESDEKEDGEGATGAGEGSGPSDEDGKDKAKRKKRPHGKIGFESLAKVIGQRWQELSADQVEYYKKQAEVDMKRYKQEMEVYLGRRDNEGERGGIKENDDGGDHEDAPASKKSKSEQGATTE